MKVKLTVQERNNLKSLIENPQLGGGTSLGQIRSMLDLVDKLEYEGTKTGQTMTEIELTDRQVKTLYDRANSFTGWPVTTQTLDMKQRLEQYHQQTKDQ